MLIKLDLDQIDKGIKKRIKYLPTKDEFYGAMNKIMGRFNDLQQEMSAIGFRT